MTETKRRYARHLVLPDIGDTGQARLAASSVLVIGAGGLGAAVVGNLAAMGIGHIYCVDDDRVELSNLNRQTLYETGDIGRLKVEAAADAVDELNPEVQFHPIAVRVSAENLPELVDCIDVVVDGSDNFATRFAVHEAAFKAKKILVTAAVSGFSGQLSTFKAHLGVPHPCYCCFVPESPEREISCAQEGILGALAGIMGGLQAVEVVKELLGIGQSLSGRILLYDALAGDFRTVLLQREPTCILCGNSSFSSLS